MFNPILILVGLTVLVSAYAWSNHDLMESWILRPYVMARDNGQWYRFLTSGFLHADWGHLLFNMIAFFSFGQLVLQVLANGTGAPGLEGFGAVGGLWRFLLLYLGGIVVSDIPTYFRHRDDRDYGSLGASGGVAAVLFAGVIFAPLNKIGLIFIPGDGIPGFIFGFLYLAYSYYQGRRRGDNINHDAHFYGAIYGVVLTLVFMPASGLEFVRQIGRFTHSII
ncbi:rhomboid family intramembrane serine protease [Hymenobacter terricola]|uniref:rhomboid family intramembrane serine protease n=1 Tax=Hymenobacter terricola TaxID=2819236 RepID=UPI001CF43356|nr:rhomboid family intramembrane serine protease [Hymenobacter terricola]